MTASAKPRGYHHGNLRAALLAAAEAELSEVGIEGFTLRGCARRAGVSHSAPATFFKDTTAFFTEIAAAAFEQLTGAMLAGRSMASGDPVEAMVGIGRAYASFAAAKPHHFRLMWRKERLDRSNPRLLSASRAAFGVPVACVGDLYATANPMADPVQAGRVIALWSMIHGVSDLLIAGQLDASGLGSSAAIIDAVVPPMIREHFTKPG